MACSGPPQANERSQLAHPDTTRPDRPATSVRAITQIAQQLHLNLYLSNPAHISPAEPNMIMIFLCTWLVGWSLAVLLRQPAGTALRARLTSLDQCTARVSPATGPEDDPVRWPAAVVHSDWTELDERQLIRLLTNPTS